MIFSKRNKKVAIARWKNKHAIEKNNIRKDKQALLLKSALCGFLAGDGSVQKRKEKNFFHYQLDFFPDDDLMKDTYITQLKKVYKKEPKTTKKKNYFEVRITSKVIVEDLLKLANFSTHNWTTPEKLFDTQDSKTHWLKAFFSAEAYVNAKSIKIQTVNKQGMKKIVNMLIDYGINSNMYEYIPKKPNHSKVYIVFINKKEERKKYLNKIGFWHNKKTKTLKEALDL